MLAMICNFVPEISDGGWEVLRRVPDRCGEPIDLGMSPVTAGQPVTVPAAPYGSIVVASFDLPESLGARLGSLAFKPLAPAHLEVNGLSYRVPRPHLAGPLLMSLPDESGWANGHRLPYETVLAESDGTVTFHAVPIG